LTAFLGLCYSRIALKKRQPFVRGDREFPLYQGWRFLLQKFFDEPT